MLLATQVGAGPRARLAREYDRRRSGFSLDPGQAGRRLFAVEVERHRLQPGDTAERMANSAAPTIFARSSDARESAISVSRMGGRAV